MQLDEEGNPIKELEQAPVVPSDEDFVDNLISGLLSDDEKKSLIKPKQEEPLEKTEPAEPEAVKPAPEPQEIKEEELKDRIFVVDGERLTYDQLKAGNLRQSDYTRKTQAIADEKARMAKFQVLNDYLEKNPNEFNRVVELFKQPKQEVPEDPIDAITHNATQAAIAALRGPIDGFNGQISAMQKQQQIAQVQTAVAMDPLKDDTQKAMESYVWGEYAELHGQEEATKLFQVLDTEPARYVDLYTKMRKRVEAKAPKKVVSVEKKVPFVADSGQDTPPVNKDKMKRRDIRALQEKTRGGRVEDVVSFLEATGMVDHLS